MELTAKMLEEIKAAAQKALETSPQSRATSTVILALVTELERRDAEIAALREKLERVSFVAAARAKDLQTLMESRD